MKRVGTVWKLLAAMAVLFVAVRPLCASIPVDCQRGRECALGRRTAAVRPSGATDAFGYDGLGNWTTYTNAEGRVYTMTYDALGRPLTATNAANEQVFANRYDPVGNLTNRTDGAGNTIAYGYDVLNRLVVRDAFNHEPHERHENFSYDAVGNLLTASNTTASLSFAYDAMDRLTSSVSRVTLSPVSSFEFPVSNSRTPALTLSRTPTPPHLSHAADPPNDTLATSCRTQTVQPVANRGFSCLARLVLNCEAYFRGTRREPAKGT